MELIKQTKIIKSAEATFLQRKIEAAEQSARIQQTLLDDATLVMKKARTAANVAFKLMQIKINERRDRKAKEDSATVRRQIQMEIVLRAKEAQRAN